MQTEKKNPKTRGLKLISFLMALLLWFYVVNLGELDARQTIREVELTYYNLAEGLIVDGPASVEIKMWGSFGEPGEIIAYVDLDGLGPGDYKIQVNLSPVQGAMFTTVEPNRVEVELRELRQDYTVISYEIRQNPPPGYELVEVILEPQQCIVQGEQALVEQVASVVAPLNLSNIQNVVAFRVKLEARDGAGRLIEQGIRILPEDITVYAALERKRGVKAVAVTSNLTGELEAGFQIKEVVLDPMEVILLGDEARLQPLETITLQALDLSSETETFSRRMGLQLPEGVNAYPAEVLVVVTIERVSEEETEEDVP